MYILDVRTVETTLWTPGLGGEHGFDTLETAGAELPVVLLVSARRAGEHDVVAVFAAGNANFVILGIVLEKRKEKKKKTNYYQEKST